MALPEDRPMVSSRLDSRNADTGELLAPGSRLHLRGKKLHGSTGDLLQVRCQGSLVARIYRTGEGVLWVEMPGDDDTEIRRDARNLIEQPEMVDARIQQPGLPLLDDVNVPINCACGYQHLLDPTHLIELVDRLGGARDRKLRRIDIDRIRRVSLDGSA